MGGACSDVETEQQSLMASERTAAVNATAEAMQARLEELEQRSAEAMAELAAQAKLDGQERQRLQRLESEWRAQERRQAELEEAARGGQRRFERHRAELQQQVSAQNAALRALSEREVQLKEQMRRMTDTFRGQEQLVLSTHETSKMKAQREKEQALHVVDQLSKALQRATEERDQAHRKLEELHEAQLVDEEAAKSAMQLAAEMRSQVTVTRTTCVNMSQPYDVPRAQTGRPSPAAMGAADGSTLGCRPKGRVDDVHICDALVQTVACSAENSLAGHRRYTKWWTRRGPPSKLAASGSKSRSRQTGRQGRRRLRTGWMRRLTPPCCATPGRRRTTTSSRSGPCSLVTARGGDGADSLLSSSAVL